MERVLLDLEWQLEDEIGRGGFGRVYRGTGSDGQPVAIKLIAKEPGTDNELLFSNLPESEYLVPVLDRGEWNGSWVIVMPLADESLRAYIDRSSGRVADVVPPLSDIANALASLGTGVVHRDIKPENILDLNDKWRIGDFGIARYAEETTRAETWKGALSAPYAAPERWRMERATQATDVYSFGVIAFELMTGEWPFPGPTVEDFCEQHLGQTPPELSGCPVPLASLIWECLYKAPAARPSPGNILARLSQMNVPRSEALDLLVQANQAEVKRESRDQTARIQAQTEDERRSGLFDVAASSLTRISEDLQTRIMNGASRARITEHGGSGFVCELGSGTLRLGSCSRPDTDGSAKTGNPLPFDVIAHVGITVEIPEDRYGYRGRQHSLWYCDAVTVGAYRWYETAFMFNPFSGKGSKIEPFAKEPDNSVGPALSGVTDSVQVAWPFTPIDQGQEGDFIDRWINWFALAANGQLRKPSRMPEKTPQGSWRSGA